MPIGYSTPTLSARLLILLVSLLLIAALPAAAKRGKKTPPAEEKTAEEESWDVMNPPGEWSEVTIDVDQGTWMNLDVSPDGSEIVFDLLGDLYALPIEGGEARALTSGIAWDMQPRYSPDGQWISFTSDRAGGDNVWILPSAGGEPEQVTKEDFRLLNNAVWSPDGDYLAARKHFTSRRSLGAGEIWLYHRTGGGGLQITERPNDQKDVGEPAFSPDGRYVYYSRDSTPGGVFQYNKDPNTQIYTIHRVDRMTGEVETVIDGPGGAVRPTPSPDGEHLAFVRRVRDKTVLFVRELASGRTLPLFDGLERDMQETWAVHGVYPNFAWTPDGQSIVFWAGGKIHRVDVASRAVEEIPFRVSQTHRVGAAVRAPIEVAPKRFEVRMPRFVTVSPRGDEVVFEALGRLWVRQLPLGNPLPLTGEERPEHFELYPSYSRDGQWIVYVTWDDEELGSVRAISTDSGRQTRILTSEPGHYVEPVVSPDVQTVVYRKVSGGFVTSPLHSLDTGLYRVSFKGGEAVRIAERGARPHFGARSDRVYFMTRESGDRRTLSSVGLDVDPERGFNVEARREIRHLESAAATDFRVSPDGRWVAWSERFDAHIAPFVPTGKPLELGPKTKTIPTARVSLDAGDHLSWSRDAKTLYWTLGPQLKSRALRDAFAFLEGAPEELPEPPTEGVDLGLEANADRPEGKIAFVGGRIITLRADQTDEVIEDGTIVIDGHRIAAVGPSSEVEVPEDALVIEIPGRTVIPGLIDVHWHGAQGTNEIVPQQNWFNYATLAFGVTTIHDPSTDTSTFFAASELARAGLITAPRLFSTGTILYGAAGDFKAEIGSLEDARSHLRRMQSVGAFSVKSYNQPRRDQRQQVLQAARELGMLVVPEGGSLFQHNMTMVVDGHTGIEHAIPVAAIYDDVRQLWGATGVGYTPTMGVAYGGIWGENYWYRHTDVWANGRLMSFVPRFVVDPSARRRMAAPAEEYNHVNAARVATELAREGVLVALGAHGQREGLAAHWELWMLVQGGMTPLEALKAGTLDGARYLGLDADVGSLEAGKLADLAILLDNPLEDIRNTDSVSQVMVNGRLYNAATMDEMGHDESAREPFFFEREGEGDAGLSIEAISELMSFCAH